MTDRNLRWCFYGFSLGVLGYALVLSRVAVGVDFLNSYPFVSADGFDWLYQGYALHERLVRGDSAPSLYLLRDPGFVLVSALDASLRARGLVIILAHALSFLATGLVLLKAARFYDVPVVVAVAVMLIALLGPLNYFRLFVLADPLAVAFLTISAYAMLHHLRTGSVVALAASGGFAVAGGMTQTYAAIPFLVGAGISSVANVHSTRRLLQISVAVVVVAGCLIALKAGWSAAIPHEAQPFIFGFLKLSLGTARFYAHVWSLVYLPLLPLAATALIWWYRSGRRFPAEVLFLGGTVLAFVLLSFMYQWREARFTFIYQPLVLLLLIALSARDSAGLSSSAVAPLRRLTSIGGMCSAVLVASQLAVTPSTYWEPTLRTLAWRPDRSWVLQAWNARPRDRFGLGVSAPALSYAEATISSCYGQYARRIVSSYLDLRTREDIRAAAEQGRIAEPGAQPGSRAEAATDATKTFSHDDDCR